MTRARPIAMVTAVNMTLNLYFNGASHSVIFPLPFVVMSVARVGNAIRIQYQYTAPPYLGAAFEIAIDDLGFPGATVHPLGPLN